MDTGIPQGSSAAPILFVTYLSGILGEVEAAVPGMCGLFFVDDIGWWADGADDGAVAAGLSEAAAASIDWAANSGLWPREDGGSNLPKDEDPAHGRGEARGQQGPIQQRGNAVARSLAGLPANA